MSDKISYSEILRINNSLRPQEDDPDILNISVLSNIVVNQCAQIIEWSLRSRGIPAVVNIGNYDNIVQESIKPAQDGATVIFWELANLVDGLNYRSEVLDDVKIDELIAKTKGELELVFNNLKDCPLVVFNQFSTLVFNSTNIFKNKFDLICDELNMFLETYKPVNVVLVDLNKVISSTSIKKSVDLRYFYSSKALYTISFYQEYADFVQPVFSALKGKAKKVLVFDCDNTLWKGVIGEDGINDILMSSQDAKGAPFEEVQFLAKQLLEKGVVLCLCSKNNSEDAQEVFESHPDRVLKNEQFIVKKINWKDKVSNLKEIATELNVGLDSLVFVDDSDFEVNFVRKYLPEVEVIQVPKKVHRYAVLFRAKMNLFLNLRSTNEDSNKTRMYRAESSRLELKSDLKSIKDYVKKLGIELLIEVDSEVLVERAAQLTQKTNQFNLTTKRYSESEIRKFVSDKNVKVFSMSATDKFGDYGTVGLSIVRCNFVENLASIDTFLQSCRIIGRGVEFRFFESIVSQLKGLGIEKIEAKYRSTMKNDQVSTFYDTLSFKLSGEEGNEKLYILNIRDHKKTGNQEIGLKHGR